MSGARHKRKGSRIEREIVGLHRELGIDARRVPLSGAVPSYPGDVELEEVGVGEVKARKDGQGFVQLERWLGGNDALFLRRNNAAPLVLLPWRSYARLLQAAKFRRVVREWLKNGPLDCADGMNYLRAVLSEEGLFDGN